MKLDPESETVFYTESKKNPTGYALTMGCTTKYLNWLATVGYKVVSSTVDISNYSGYVTKTHLWTLQK